MKSLIRSHTGCVKSIRHQGALSDPEIWVLDEPMTGLDHKLLDLKN